VVSLPEGPVKLALNVVLSLVVLALCLFLVWPNAHVRAELAQSLRALELARFWPYLAGYVGLLAATHFFRAWRWNNLLRPMGMSLPARKLLAISSVGFMAILALPARLGELARPALLRQKGKVSASAVLGTVAVERIVDGLVVSLLVFGCCFALRGGAYERSWMMPTAWASLGVFVAAMTFLGFALRWPRATARIAVRLTLVELISPRLAAKLEDKLLHLIRGFLVLKDRRNLVCFCAWSLAYWGTNGLGMWVLARGMGLDLSVIGAFATMGIIAVGITLPNSPGLVGQFHYLTTLGLSLYMPKSVADSAGLAYAILLHGIQVVWYVGAGAVSMFTSHVSFADVLRRPTLEEEAADDAQQEAA
jgi:glycosyltransferase 2 family protein